MAKSYDEYRLGEPYEPPRYKGLKIVAILATLMAITILPAMAAKGGNGGGKHGGGGSSGSGGTSTCTQNPPRLNVDNTWAWASPGSWGMPGQTLKYAIDVINDDSGCGSTSFTVDVAAPDGFTVSIPTNMISLASASTGYVWAYVTSPASATDGNYKLDVSVQRSDGSGSGGSATSYYKVYSSDSTPPKLFWENPNDGGAVSGSSVNVGFASSDDHAVKTLDIRIDGNVVTSVTCSNISSDCRASYAWSIRQVSGKHDATFKSTDWMGNVASETVTFTVN
jgi:hypothetical protein